MKAYFLWDDLIDVLCSGQTQLPMVQRWSKYDKPEQESSIRKQNSLQHSYSIAILGKIFCLKLKSWLSLDEALLMTALLLHDHGEGELKRDTLYIDKNIQGDIDEYQAFKERYKKLPEFEALEKAFLLQFASDPYSLSPDYRAKLSDIFNANPYEVAAFNAIERWDYLLYAIEQFQAHNNEKILVQTLRHQFPHLDKLTATLPGFGQAIWTEEVRAALKNFLNQHDGKWIEVKGEK